jgi:peptidoglycan/LPS O-acetylase OafA/YrhL
MEQGQAPNQETNWIPAIDGCRAVAALAVVVDHYQPWRDLSGVWPYTIWARTCSLFGFGALGVIFFFALSSFLLTFLSLREHQRTGSFSIRKFYVRRMLRIWPLYYVILAAYIALGLISRSHFNGTDNSWLREFWVYPMFVQNWFNMTRSDMGILCSESRSSSICSSLGCCRCCCCTSPAP